MKALVTTIACLAFAATATAQQVNPIKVNQVGYFPNTEKTATIEERGVADTYTLTNAKTGKKVWKGKAKRTGVSPWSGKKRTIIDFSKVTKPGQYVLSNGKDKQNITISSNALSDLVVSGMKSFYLQRSSEPILEKHAGVYARKSAHPDNKVMIHPSAVSENRPAGTIIQSSGGWYDAGDYNKYIVNSAYSIGLMLAAYENSKEYFNNMELNIPESYNATPDFLDEIMVNLRWMQTMQDPFDGGVYHKLTTPFFEAFIMPEQCKQQRYVVQKSTAATLDFAACMAMASRIYQSFPEYKDWAKEALAKAKRAYEWAEKNPEVLYRQAENNKKYEIEVLTGEYGDSNVSDELIWAATELHITTGDNKYNLSADFSHFTLPSWGDVSGLAYYSLLTHQSNNKELFQPILRYADDCISYISTSCYNSPYGNKAEDFGWGCNGEKCAGMGLALLYAYKITGHKTYLNGALKVADYLLGRNATGYCYVTGFGSMSPQYPHQRLSAADGIEAPLPGFLVGGPNPGQQDGCTTYPSSFPDESYTDNEESYASNEIAINWNAALVAFTAWLDASMQK